MPGRIGGDDHAQPDPGLVIRWPAGFSPQLSDVWARRKLTVYAPPASVFSHLTSAGRWSGAFAGVRNVHLLTPGDDGLGPDSEFEFEVDGLGVSAQVVEFVAGGRLAWLGHGIDISVYHGWAVAGAPDGSYVLAGFAARGAAAIALRELSAGAPQRFLDRWVTGLKQAAESAPG